MSREITEIQAFDSLRLPQPLGELCRRYTNLDDDDFSDKITTLKEMFEVVIKLVGAAVVKVYLSESEKYKDAEDTRTLREMIEKLERPSLGDWTRLVDKLVKVFAKRPDDRLPFIAQLTSYYRAGLPGGKNGKTYEAASVIGSYLNEKRNWTTNQTLFELMVNARNKLSAGGHSASLNEVDIARAAGALETVVASILNGLKFLENMDLFFVERVTKIKGETVYEVKSFNNVLVSRERISQAGKLDLCFDGEFYLAEVDRSVEGLPSVKKAVSLSPLVVFQHCSTTKTEQVFFFNGKRGKSLEYLCYATGGLYWPPDLEKEFDDIVRVLRGEVSSAEIFRPVDSDAERVSTSEERKAAEELSLDGLSAIRHGAAELGLKHAHDALHLDKHCGLAFFARGLGYCNLARIQECLLAFRQCTELNPQEPSFLLAHALTLAVGGQDDESLSYFTRLKKIDATNEHAEHALASSGSPAASFFDAEDPIDAKLRRVVQLVFQQRDTDNLQIDSWLYRLPPWRQIYKLSKNRWLPVPPVVSSLVLALGMFFLPVLFHFPLLFKWGFASSESCAMYARHGVIASTCFLGFWNIFAFNALLKRVYGDLGRMVVMPREVFRQWFMSEMGNVSGSANFPNDTVPKTSWRGLFRKDRRFLVPYTIFILVCLGPHWGNSGDWNPLMPYPSELANSLAAGDVREVDLSREWNWIQFIVRHFVYYAQVYLCGWAPIFIVALIPFFVRILRLPIRYYPGISSSMTLRAVSNAFVWLNVPCFAFVSLSILQFMAFNSLRHAPIAAGFYLILIPFLLTLYIAIPAAGIGATMRAQRVRVLEEFSGNLEKAYANCASRADLESFESLRDSASFMRELRRLCPTFPLSGISFLMASGMLIATFALVAGYLYVALELDWPRF